MKNESNPLPPLEELSQHFAPYREALPLLDSKQVEKLLVQRDMLPNTSPINVRKIIMTVLSTIVAGVLLYFVLANVWQAETTAPRKGINAVPSTTSPLPNNQSTPKPQQKLPPPVVATAQASGKIEHGTWSAGTDQMYADLSPAELARLGITRGPNDTILSYNISPKGQIEGMKLTPHSVGGSDSTYGLRAGVHIPRFYPVLMTFGNGHGASYRVEDAMSKEWGMVSDDKTENDIRDWLHKPGTPGYYTLGFSTVQVTDDKGHRSDTVKVLIGKDLPQPRLFPFEKPTAPGYSDTLMEGIAQLADFYNGSTSTKPILKIPATLSVKVDTLSAQSLLQQLDYDENNGSLNKVRKIMARLNELIPVIIRKGTSHGSPDSNDFIFWYEPTDELFAALPSKQAEAFRAKLNNPPQCLTSPNAVLTSAEITYCVDKPQKVHITIHDLTGRPRIDWDADAVAGDNITRVGTETLSSGMYLVTVENADHTERTKRIWVENAHPKRVGWENAGLKPTQSWLSYDEDSTDDDGQAAILAVPYLKLDNTVLAAIGIRSNDSLAGFYFVPDRKGHVNFTQLLRHWNPQDRIYKPTLVQVGGVRNEFLRDGNITDVTPRNFQPLFITNGKGRKRLFTSDSDITSAQDDPKTVLQKFQEIDKEFQIDRLIPILLPASTNNDSVGGKDIIFWYKPTAEFLALLPDSIRNLVNSQVRAASTINIGNIGHASVEAGHGAIRNAIAYPNPSTGKLNVKLSMDSQRNLTITLRNLLGQQAYTPLQIQTEGESEQKLDFSNISEGIYLLDIASDRGERFVQRIVIER